MNACARVVLKQYEENNGNEKSEVAMDALLR
jgi:hypothetical protein